MEKYELDEILAALTGERTLFRYTRDGYALQLLRDYIGQGMNIAQLRQSPFANWLNKPIVKQALAHAGKGELKPQHLDWATWEQDALNFVLTLDQWGDERNSQRKWKQMSRTGYHLVLQLNFANDHQQCFQQLVKGADHGEFSYWGHPINKDSKHETLAWARIDVDFASNQALIEELQSDWVRHVKRDWKTWRFSNIHTYREVVLKPYAQVWDEALMAATIQLIRHDLGIKEIFYNTFDTGNFLKGIRGDSKPPRSMYTTLPEKFAFTMTDEVPQFLQGLREVNKAQRKIAGGARWFKLPH